MKSKEEILEELENNEIDYWNLPQYGLIADWFERYWDLHNMVLEYFGEEPYDYPLAARDYTIKKRNESLTQDS